MLRDMMKGMQRFTALLKTAEDKGGEHHRPTDRMLNDDDDDGGGGIISNARQLFTVTVTLTLTHAHTHIETSYAVVVVVCSVVIYRNYFFLFSNLFRVTIRQFG